MNKKIYLATYLPPREEQIKTDLQSMANENGVTLNTQIRNILRIAVEKWNKKKGKK